MRITGGEWRSRRLLGPSRNMPLRPTPDALRERAFAVLGERVRGTRFLDLFAGTGSVGFEALSRGAESVVFVERHRAAAKLVEKNRTNLDISPSRAQVLVRPANAAISDLADRVQSFDIVWADPPFESWEHGAEALAKTFAVGLLTANSIACLECPSHAEVEAHFPESLCVERDLKGSASRVVLIRYK